MISKLITGSETCVIQYNNLKIRALKHINDIHRNKLYIKEF